MNLKSSRYPVKSHNRREEPGQHFSNPYPYADKAYSENARANSEYNATAYPYVFCQRGTPHLHGDDAKTQPAPPKPQKR